MLESENILLRRAYIVLRLVLPQRTQRAQRNLYCLALPFMAGFLFF